MRCSVEKNEAGGELENYEYIAILQKSHSREGPVTLATRQIIGLCATCVNAADCVYRRRRGFDALYCELFDALAPKTQSPGQAATVVMAARGETPAAEDHELKGLCVNCVHRDTCQLPKPRGGVWHCEMYE